MIFCILQHMNAQPVVLGLVVAFERGQKGWAAMSGEVGFSTKGRGVNGAPCKLGEGGGLGQGLNG